MKLIALEEREETQMGEKETGYKTGQELQRQQQPYKRLYRLRGAAQCGSSAVCAPGQSWSGFNGPSKAAVALTSAGMAFIR